MKVLVIGSGGREHAIAWKVSQSRRLDQLFCAPGNAGTAALGENVSISGSNIDTLLDFVTDRGVDLTIVGPEVPLVEGVVDRFREAGKAIVGPSGRAAILEGSKAFAKDFMDRFGIPTARYRSFEKSEEAEASLRSGEFPFPVVLKADGLAAGKGVFICRDLPAALEALDRIMRAKTFGSAGERLVIEEFLVGQEASFMVLTDGKNVLPLAASQDHKAVYDGDRGPNTGGMGAYSTDDILSQGIRERVLVEIIEPAVEGMAQLDRTLGGVLYAGLMLTEAGPKVLEFNVRFGDPETQVVLPRLETDAIDLFQAAARNDLSAIELEWDQRPAVCVVLTAQGYPGAYSKGFRISGLELADEGAETVVFHAGTSFDDHGRVVSNGGRVLGVSSRGPLLAEAIANAYEGVNKIHFDGMYYRRDIGAKAALLQSSSR